jgi:hypothetical protein
MVRPYPNATQTADIGEPAPPPSLLTAVKVMYVGAAAGVVHGIIYIVTASATKTAIEKKNPTLSASSVNTATTAGVAIGAITALIAAALFIWIARKSKQGKNWARVTATVFFFVAILGTVYDVVAAEASLVRIFNFVDLAIGLVAIVLLWMPSSSAYFTYFKRPQQF